MSEVLDAAAASFLSEHSECLDPALIHDRCEEVSEAFAAHLAEAGVEATVVSGMRLQDLPGGGVLVLGGHFAVLVGDVVYDWTARQFQPAVPVPLVVSYDQWRQVWKDLDAAFE